MKLLVDQMWPASLAQQLRQRGHDVVAVLEREDLAHQEDDAVWEAACREVRAVFTENVADYLPLSTQYLGRSEPFYGLVLTSDRGLPRGHPRTLGRVVKALVRFLAEHPEGEARKNQIDWLPSPDERKRSPGRSG